MNELVPLRVVDVDTPPADYRRLLSPDEPVTGPDGQTLRVLAISTRSNPEHGAARPFTRRAA